MIQRSVLALLCAVSVLMLQPGCAGLRAEAQAVGAGDGSQPSYVSDPKFVAAMADAKHLATRHEFAFACDAYKKANKIAGGRCLDCLKALYSTQMVSGSFKDAASTASEMEQLAASPAAKSVAEFRRADAIFQGAGDKPKPDKLQAAHGVLQEALANSPENAAALFLDGKIMAHLGQMEDAKADFAKCVDCVNPRDPGKLRAQHFAENPELALHKMAPAFEVTALDGTKFNLDAMGGRVVLIDFWATWCGPCNRELPHMKEIAKQFAGEPLVIISVSWDADEAKWKDFIAKNGMTWVQYRDVDKKLTDEFGVEAIPHYFTIDSDGVLTSEMLGEGADVEGKLKKLIARAREAPKQTVARSASGAGTKDSVAAHLSDGRAVPKVGHPAVAN